MKTLFLFLLVFNFSSGAKGKVNLVPIGINQIISEHYERHGERFDFVVLGKSSKSLSRLVDEIEQMKPIEFPYRVAVEADGKFDHFLHRSSIILADNYSNFKRLVSRKDFFKIGHFLVYIEDVDIDRFLRDVETVEVEKAIQFCYLIESSEHSLKLVTWQQFHQPNCRQWKLIELNEMTTAEKVWRKSDFFPKRFENFNNCELIVKSPQLWPPFISFVKDKRSKTGFNKGKGIVIRVHETVSKALNFTTFFNVGYLPDNHDKLKPSNETLKNDFRLGTSSLHLIVVANASCLTYAFATRVDLFLIPLGQPYTSFEKLFMPFDFDVWIWMIITLSSGVTTILIVKLAPKSVQHFVFGRRVRSPIMNMT